MCETDRLSNHVTSYRVGKWNSSNCLLDEVKAVRHNWGGLRVNLIFSLMLSLETWQKLVPFKSEEVGGGAYSFEEVGNPRILWSCLGLFCRALLFRTAATSRLEQSRLVNYKLVEKYLFQNLSRVDSLPYTTDIGIHQWSKCSRTPFWPNIFSAWRGLRDVMLNTLTDNLFSAGRGTISVDIRSLFWVRWKPLCSKHAKNNFLKNITVLPSYIYIYL